MEFIDGILSVTLAYQIYFVWLIGTHSCGFGEASAETVETERFAINGDMLHLVVIDMVATHRIVVMQHEGHFLKPLKLFARHSLTHIATLDESVLIEYRKLAVQTIEDMEITIADEVFRCAIAEGDIADVQSGGAAHIHLIIYIAGIFTHIMIETIVWIGIAYTDTSAP